MSTINIVIAVITVIMGGGGLGALYAARVNAKRFNAQSETEARAGFTAEFEAFAKAQSEQIEGMKADMAALKTETKAEVREIRAELQNAENYIDELIIGISNGTIPPIPRRLPPTHPET